MSIALAWLVFTTLPGADITPAQIEAIGFDGLPDDRGVEAPFALILATTRDDYQTALATAEFVAALERWPAATGSDHRQRLAALLSVLALADLTRKAYEAEAPLIVLQRLQATLPPAELQRLLAEAILDPQHLAVLTEIPELSLLPCDLQMVRQRAVIYATKLLGRSRGYLPRQSP